VVTGLLHVLQSAGWSSGSLQAGSGTVLKIIGNLGADVTYTRSVGTALVTGNASGELSLGSAGKVVILGSVSDGVSASGAGLVNVGPLSGTSELGSLGVLLVRGTVAGDVSADGARVVKVLGDLAGGMDLRGGATTVVVVTGDVHEAGGRASIQADSVHAMTVIGDLTDADLLLGSGGGNVVKVLGDVQGSQVLSQGDVGLLVANRLLDSDVQAGVPQFGQLAQPEGGQLDLDEATLGRLILRGVGVGPDEYALADSTIAAEHLGTLLLVNPDVYEEDSQVGLHGGTLDLLIAREPGEVNRLTNDDWQELVSSVGAGEEPDVPPGLEIMRVV
jgi:hypothetical protein